VTIDVQREGFEGCKADVINAVVFDAIKLNNGIPRLIGAESQHCTAVRGSQSMRSMAHLNSASKLCAISSIN